MRTKTSKFALSAVTLATAMALGLCQPANAALQAVGPVSVDNGFPIWYEDANALRLDLCLDQNGFCLTAEPNPALPIAFPGNFGPEAFWWAAETSLADNGNGITGLLVLATEAAFSSASGDAAVGEQIVFNRIRLRVDVPTPGAYTVTHPFGSQTYNVAAVGPAAEINETVDFGAIAPAPAPRDFVTALGGAIGPFLTRTDNQVFVEPISGNTYISNPNTPTAVTGSPTGNNLFSVVGPAGTATTNQFILMGKVSGCTAANLAPVAGNDQVVAAAATPMKLRVTANDTDDAGINKNTLTIVSQPLDASNLPTADIVTNPDGTVTFTSVPGISGNLTFTYTVQDFCGLTSAPATVTVAVDDVKALDARYRTKQGRWTISGTSSTIGDTITASVGPRAILSGDQEVPAVVSDGSGTALFKVNAGGTAIDYTLSYSGLTDVTQAHIHSGAIGVNGPANAFLCSNLAPPAGLPVPPTCPATGGTVSGTLTAANFIAGGAVTTFDQLLAAIPAGDTYANVHTPLKPAGEIRGQIKRDTLFTTTVQPNGKWRGSAKSTFTPGAARGNIEVKSATSGVINNIELKKR
ncbi:MAG: CHRD domain-containing protein [Sideroxyarcus sp.]|nr:CHRD domain-containing protein [Sideroxyarcus sp.]